MTMLETKKIDIYAYDSSASFLVDFLSREGRGHRSRLCRYLGVRSAFLSQVLNGKQILSPERGERVAYYFEMSEDEKTFFIYLLLREKSGTQSLKEFFTKRMNSLRAKQARIRSAIKKDASSGESECWEYYTKWWFAAVHICTSISTYQTVEKIAHRLRLEVDVVLVVLEKLFAWGFVDSPKKGVYKITKKRVHLGSTSPMIFSHHSNWRTKAVDMIGQNKKESLHYSSVVSLSEKDFLRVKKLFLELVKQHEEILIGSPEEEIYSICFDVFKL